MVRAKIFEERSSLFDHLSVVNPYFNGLYRAVKVQLTVFIIYVLARDSFQAKWLHIDVSLDRLILGGIRDWLLFAGVECILVLAFLLSYFIFVVWYKLRQFVGKLANMLYLSYFLAYICGSLYFVWFSTYSNSVASLPRLIAFIEQIRLCMKSYSFIRENAYKVLYPWHKDDDFGPAVWYAGQMSPQVGSFSQYLYFMFAPTLLYRDHYPRNKAPIKWSNVSLYAFQFLCCYLVARVMFIELMFPESFRVDSLVKSYLLCLLCGPFLFFLANLLVTNSWFNFTAELTRFADREFYLNWWSAVGYSEYYRLWNIPVYDFLHSYVYRELSPWLSYRPLAALPALLLSSILHDFLTGVAMGFFFPVFIVLFATIGGVVLLSGVKFSKFNTFLLTCVGFFLFQSFFFTELASRNYCPEISHGPLQFTTFYCYQKFNANSTVF